MFWNVLLKLTRWKSSIEKVIDLAMNKCNKIFSTKTVVSTKKLVEIHNTWMNHHFVKENKACPDMCKVFFVNSLWFENVYLRHPVVCAKWMALAQLIKINWHKYKMQWGSIYIYLYLLRLCRQLQWVEINPKYY